MEIMEELCDSSSFDCNRMLEEHEDHFETWWFKRWVLVAKFNAMIDRGITFELCVY